MGGARRHTCRLHRARWRCAGGWTAKSLLLVVALATEEATTHRCGSPRRCPVNARYIVASSTAHCGHKKVSCSSRTYSAVARCIGPTGRRGESRPPLGERRPRSLSSTAAVSRRHTFTAAPSGCSERDHHRRGNGTNRPGRPRCGCAKPSLGCTRPLHHAVCPYSHHAGHTPRIPSREL